MEQLQHCRFHESEWWRTESDWLHAFGEGMVKTSGTNTTTARTWPDTIYVAMFWNDGVSVLSSPWDSQLSDCPTWHFNKSIHHLMSPNDTACGTGQFSLANGKTFLCKGFESPNAGHYVQKCSNCQNRKQRGKVMNTHSAARERHVAPWIEVAALTQLDHGRFLRQGIVTMAGA